MLQDEELLANLLSAPSITPNDSGCIEIISNFLGLEPIYYNRNQTKNAYFETGSGNKCLLFVGHTDVVPPGPPEDWAQDPFTYISSDPIIARGIVDMKGAIWAFCSALRACTNLNIKVGILLTSDEEGDGKDGIEYVVNQLKHSHFKADYALVGEPTSVHYVGDYFKHARRGSHTYILTLKGTQGHTAYPQNAWAASQTIQAFFETFLAYKSQLPKDHDASLFSIQSSTSTSNIVPNKITIGVNIRYFDPDVLSQFTETLRPIVSTIEELGGAKPYQSNPTKIKNYLTSAIEDTIGLRPQASCLGGTSDARHLHIIADEIIEFGLRSTYAHHINEQASIEDLMQLRSIYKKLLSSLI